MDNVHMAKNISETIAHSLSTWMESTPLLSTLQKVAQKSGVGYGTLQRVRAGQGNVTVENLEKIAAAFGKTAADLMLDTPLSNLMAAASQTLSPGAIQIARKFDLLNDGNKLIITGGIDSLLVTQPPESHQANGTSN